MSKQDRQGVRNPADLERKHSRVLSGQDDLNATQNSAIEQLKKTVSGNSSSANFAITQLNARVSALEETLSGMESNAERVTALEEANATQDETITALTERVTALETTVSGLTERLTTAETTLVSLDARVAALET